MKLPTRTLPAWLQEALQGDPTDTLPNKRAETRKVFCFLARVDRADPPAGEPVVVRLFNVGRGGVGFTARQPFTAGTRLRLAPDESSDAHQAVFARVVHCTQTIQGYKVGCRLES